MLEISDIILTGILEGLRRKPVLIVHFLFATILAMILEIFVRTIINYFHISALNYSEAILVSIFVILILTLNKYISLWNKIWDSLYENLYEKSPEESALKQLENVFKDPQGFLREIMDKTIYDFLDKESILEKVWPIASKLLLFYYLAWISGIYLVDLSIYLSTNYQLTVLGLLMEKPIVYFTLINISHRNSKFIHKAL
ncbi:hypothetical protein [Staphylothermus hellenicus]|uniref:Uncharacterized protein n=1 Tax=Staphylothermus hellenicus (strain DSM 12710 / JCM 10830 / BK20S6-10-b1 / P8) TaxID=591019 RepID=D7DAZ8_STAHD|nr:hypothetical protein [Staphylothermus hellenicus]ADI31345.1 hypothetical protein Shell_0204 [Staphylothermus hellenicus DSM 12710]